MEILHKRIPPSGVVQDVSRHPPSGGKYDSNCFAPYDQNDITISRDYGSVK